MIEKGRVLSDWEAIRGNVKVEWSELGEGLYGDYNELDPDDVELLRFDVYVAKEDGEWVAKEDGSYCTQFPASASSEEKRKGLEILLERFYDALSNDLDVSIKKLGEELSWISLKDVQHCNKLSLDEKMENAKISVDCSVEALGFSCERKH